MLCFTKAESSVVRPTVINSDSYERTAMSWPQLTCSRARRVSVGNRKEIVLETQNSLE